MAFVLLLYLLLCKKKKTLYLSMPVKLPHVFCFCFCFLCTRTPTHEHRCPWKAEVSVPSRTRVTGVCELSIKVLGTELQSFARSICTLDCFLYSLLILTAVEATLAFDIFCYFFSLKIYLFIFN